MQNQGTEVNTSTSDMVDMGNDLQDLVPRQNFPLNRKSLKAIGIVQLVAVGVNMIIAFCFIGLTKSASPVFQSIGVWSGCVALPGIIMTLHIGVSQDTSNIQNKASACFMVNLLGMVACGVAGVLQYTKLLGSIDMDTDSKYDGVREIVIVLQVLLGLQMCSSAVIGFSAAAADIFLRHIVCCCDNGTGVVLAVQPQAAPAIFMQTTIDQQMQQPQQIPPTYAQPFQYPSQQYYNPPYSNETNANNVNINPAFQ